MDCPVIKAALREARKAARSPSSSGSHNLAAGIRSYIFCSEKFKTFNRSVFVNPGRIRLTVIPSDAYSFATDLANPARPTRKLFDVVNPATGSLAATDEIIITRPYDVRCISGSALCRESTVLSQRLSKSRFLLLIINLRKRSLCWTAGIHNEDIQPAQSDFRLKPKPAYTNISQLRIRIISQYAFMMSQANSTDMRRKIKVPSSGEHQTDSSFPRSES